MCFTSLGVLFCMVGKPHQGHFVRTEGNVMMWCPVPIFDYKTFIAETYRHVRIMTLIEMTSDYIRVCLLIANK